MGRRVRWSEGGLKRSGRPSGSYPLVGAIPMVIRPEKSWRPTRRWKRRSGGRTGMVPSGPISISLDRNSPCTAPENGYCNRRCHRRTYGPWSRTICAAYGAVGIGHSPGVFAVGRSCSPCRHRTSSHRSTISLLCRFSRLGWQQAVNFADRQETYTA